MLSIDLPYSDDAMKGSRKTCANKIGKGVWLENKRTNQQDQVYMWHLQQTQTIFQHQENMFKFDIWFQKFAEFLEQQLINFDTENDALQQERKPILEVRTPQLRKIEANYCWVTGTDMIYLINHDISEGMASFARVLTQEEIGLLPIEIVYTGPHQDFNTDEEEAFRLVARVIELMNMMQPPEWHR